MPRSSRMRVASLLAVSWLWPTVALAGARPIELPPAPLPGVQVTGAAEVSALEIVVRCDDFTIFAAASTCHVHASFDVTPTGDATVTLALTAGSPGELLVEGEATPTPLSPGERRHVDLRFDRGLAVGADHNDDIFVLLPIRARHLLLGESTATRAESDGAYGTLIAGEATIVGPITVRVTAPPELVVNVAGETVDGTAELPATSTDIALVLPAPEHEAQPIQDGGPFVVLGARFDMFRDDDGRFLLGGGYEVGIADYVLVSLAFETNFESIMESLVVEIASPEVLVILPSLAAGVGVVARQLGNRDADAALRLRAAFNVTAIGFDFDFDYWPAIGEWTASFSCRLSI